MPDDTINTEQMLRELSARLLKERRRLILHIAIASTVLAMVTVYVLNMPSTC
jgi:type IV secretory pathway component VirB8